MHADVYFDKDNDWVFIDWEGDLTLYSVQHTCLEIARCFLDNSSPRVLNSNAQVTSVSWEVSKWLGSEFLPALRLTGVEQIAWVAPATLRAHNNVLNTVNLFPHTAICLFEELDEAVAWLQQTALLRTGRGRLYSDELKLRVLVKAFLDCTMLRRGVSLLCVFLLNEHYLPGRERVFTATEIVAGEGGPMSYPCLIPVGSQGC